MNLKIFVSTFLLVSLASLFSYGQSEKHWSGLINDPNTNFLDVQASFEKAWEGKDVTKKEVTKGKGFKPFKRWEWFMEQRTFPTGERFSPSASVEAYLEHKDSPSLVGGGSGMWTYFGNTSVPSGGGAGRVNMVRVDPNNSSCYYACAPGGGLWKSENEGGSWALMNTDLLASIGVTDVAIDHSNSDILYIGTGDGDAGDTYALGVLKSIDGGNSWNPTGLSWTVQSAFRIGRLAMHPSDSNMLLAATNQGMYRTSDGGVNWTQVLTDGNNFKEVLYKPGAPNIVYCTSRSDNFYRSTDGGANWTQITSGLPTTGATRMAIAVTPANSEYVYALVGASDNGFLGLYRSTDSGLNFTEMSNATEINLMGWSTNGSGSGGQAWYDLCIAADPLNADVIYTGGVNVYKSSNGGDTWNLSGHWYGGGGADYVHADNHGMMFIPGTSNLLIGNDGGVFRTTDGGNNYSDLSANLEISQQYRLGISTLNQSQVLTGWQDNGTNYKNGAAWNRPIGGDGFECIIDHTNNNTAYGALYYGQIFKTTSGAGGGFSTILNSGGAGEHENGAWLTPYIMNPNDNQTLYVGKTGVHISADGGASWSVGPQLDGGSTLDALAVAPSNANYIYTSESGGLWRSTDAGVSYTQLTGLTGGYITYIAIDPQDEERLWITYSGFGSAAKCYASTDGGNTWSDYSTGLPDIPANTIVYQAGTLDGLYLGTDAGVYYRDSSFGSWQPYNSGLPNVVVTELEIHYPSNTLVASTYGRGLWHAPLFALPQTDGALISIDVPNGTICDPNFIPEITIGNFGSDVITSMEITYSVGGSGALTYDWTGVLVTGQTSSETLPAMNEGNGALTFSAAVTEANGIVGDDNALNDDKSAEFFVSGNENVPTLWLLTDCWASESSWEITNGTGEVVHSGSGYINDTFYEIPICLSDGCYTFTMNDSYGDGLASCSGGDFYMIDEGGVTLFSMEVLNFGTSESHEFCVPYVSIPGCTIPLADNYDSTANEEDGSCTFSCNYMSFNLLTDCWGSEVTFDIVEDATGGVLIDEGPFANTTNFVFGLCVPDGCYTLNVNDSYGDGMSSCDGGSYSLTDYEGNVLAQMGDPNYGFGATHNICLPLPSPGCMDTTACNFDSTATTDDGSCTYPGCQDSLACNFDSTAGCAGTCQYLDVCGVCGGTATTLGCTDNAACNYNAAADCDDGSCAVNDACGVCGGTGTIAGCTDTAACNYNSLADCDDGSCAVNDACGACGGPGTLSGCTDSTACNYNGAADCDDGSCLTLDACGVCGGAGSLAGCMDTTACNFDSTADCDDGACEYLSCYCEMDLAPSGYIDVTDLLIFLTDFGCGPPSDCIGDFSGDGYTNTADMLLFLVVFGSSCP